MSSMMGVAFYLGGARDSETTAKSIVDHHSNMSAYPDYVQEWQKTTEEASKRYDEAEGIWGHLSAFGHQSLDYITNPKGWWYRLVENLPMMAPPLAGMAVGGFTGAKVTKNPWGSFAVGSLGYAAGMNAVIMGEKGTELLSEMGADLTDIESVKKVLESAEYKRVAKEQGLTKGSIISVTDIAAMFAAGRLVKYGVGGLKRMSAPAKKYHKSVDDEIKKLGIDPKNSARVHQELMNNPVLLQRVAPHLENYRKSLFRFAPKKVKAGRLAGAALIETASEFTGEFAGEWKATGKAKPAQAVEEAFVGLGASVAHIAIGYGYQAGKTNTKNLLNLARKAQIKSVAEGKDSGIQPEAINEARRRFLEGTNAAVDPALTSDLRGLEWAIGDIDPTTDLTSTVEQLGDYEGYEFYANSLRDHLKSIFGDTVHLYIPMTTAEEAVLKTGGQLDRVVRGSIDIEGVTASSNQNI
ncbi:uncharacterized protein METZ01_LOCUS154749, partial [marine metagenome]